MFTTETPLPQQALLVINVQQSIRAMLESSERIEESWMSDGVTEVVHDTLHKNIETIEKALDLIEDNCGLSEEIQAPDLYLYEDPRQMLMDFSIYCSQVEKWLSKIQSSTSLGKMVGSGQLATEEAIQNWLAQA